jgi:hypothetical protein
VGEIEDSAVTVAVVLILGRGIGIIELTLVLVMKVVVELLEAETLLVGQLNSEESVPVTNFVETTEFELGGSETAGTGNDPVEFIVLGDEALIDIGCVIQGRSWLDLPGTTCDIVCEHVVLVFIGPTEAGDLGNGS